MLPLGDTGLRVLLMAAAGWLAALTAPAAAETVWYECRFSGDFEMTLRLGLDAQAQQATAIRDGRSFAAHRMYRGRESADILHIEFGPGGEDFLVMFRERDGAAEYVADFGMAWVKGVCRRN